MKALIESVQNLSLTANKATCKRTFLNGIISDPACKSMIEKMSNCSPELMGVSGQDCDYHFSKNLNKVSIDVSKENDYRLVLFFIKKGTVMPLHDHPNMSVFFRLVMGNLHYHAYDKVDEKF